MTAPSNQRLALLSRRAIFHDPDLRDSSRSMKTQSASEPTLLTVMESAHLKFRRPGTRLERNSAAMNRIQPSSLIFRIDSLVHSLYSYCLTSSFDKCDLIDLGIQWPNDHKSTRDVLQTSFTFLSEVPLK